MIESLWILILVGVTCSLVGNLLVQKQEVMVGDAISHTILLGIAVTFFLVQDLDSPWLIIGATVFGVLTVLAIEVVVAKTNVQNDAAIALILTAFFSLAVILISKFFANVHLDIDMVLLGQVIFAPLNRMTLFGHTLPRAMVENGLSLLAVLVFITLAYQPLKMRLFDESFARMRGIRLLTFDLILMTLVSLTAVVSFQNVGAILVIAMMVAPAMTAQLFAKSFVSLLTIGALVASLNAVLGYYLAVYFNVSMSGMVAVASFIVFCLAFLLTRSRVAA